MSDDLDLGGITMLDLGGLGPAARCARILADLGARWIRVQPPTNAAREQPRWHDYGALRGAEPLSLNLKNPAGQNVFRRLAQEADIIIECFRPGVADRLGVGYDRIAQSNPRIIYCSVTGYGQTGPYAQRAGHDLNYVAVSGALSTMGRRSDGAPALPGLTLADSAGGGWQAAIRILSALVARQTTGRGRFLDVSASEGVLHLMSLAIDEFLATGKEPTPGEDIFLGCYACYDVYQTSDRKWLAVAALEKKFFRNLCDALGLQGLVESQYVIEDQQRLRTVMAATFKTKTREEWENIFSTLDACVTPVLSVSEVATNKHWRERELFQAYKHPAYGTVEQLCQFGRSLNQGRGNVPAPSTTQTKAILKSFSLTEEEIETLLRDKVFE